MLPYPGIKPRETATLCTKCHAIAPVWWNLCLFILNTLCSGKLREWIKTMTVIVKQDAFVAARIIELVAKERAMALSKREWMHRIAGYGASGMHLKVRLLKRFRITCLCVPCHRNWRPDLSVSETHLRPVQSLHQAQC